MAETMKQKLVSLQEKIETKVNAVLLLKKTINDKRQLLLDMENGGMEKDELIRRKNLLKANIALGKPINREENEIITNQIEKAQKNNVLIDDIVDTISGLELMVKEETLSIEPLVWDYRLLCELRVREKMEKIAETIYMPGANKAKEGFLSLQALGVIHDEIRGNAERIVSGHEHEKFILPVFMLKACGQNLQQTIGFWPEWEDANMIKNTLPKYIKQNVEKERKNLKENGLMDVQELIESINARGVNWFEV